MSNGFEVCQMCGITSDLSFDHIVPRSHGGDNSPDNLCILCKPCNVFKDSNYFELKSLSESPPNITCIPVSLLEEGMRTLCGAVEAIGFYGRSNNRDIYCIDFSGDNCIYELMDKLSRERADKLKGRFSLPGNILMPLDPRYCMV